MSHDLPYLPGWNEVCGKVVYGRVVGCQFQTRHPCAPCHSCAACSPWVYTVPPFQHWLANDTIIHLVPYRVLYGSWQPTRLSGWYWVEGPDSMAPQSPWAVYCSPRLHRGGGGGTGIWPNHGFRGLPYGGHGGPVVARVNGDHGAPWRPVCKGVTEFCVQ